MKTLSLDASEADIVEVADYWTACLAAQEYTTAYEMLLFVATYPGKS